MFLSVFSTIDLREEGKVMASRAIPIKEPWNPVSVDLKLNLIQFLCLNTLSADNFLLKIKYFDNAE